MEEADFLIYLSELLVKSGKQVAVLDDSKEKDIFALLPFQEKDNIFTYHGVEYYKIILEKTDLEQFDTYDIVFFIIGCKAGRMEFHIPIEVFYVFLTASRKGIEKTIETVWEQEVPVVLFIRNFCEYKITAAYIRGLWREARGNIVGWYEIPFDSIDYEYAIRMQYEPVNGYRQLSKEMKEALIIVSSRLAGLTQKEEKRIYKKLKRGKKLCR